MLTLALIVVVAFSFAFALRSPNLRDRDYYESKFVEWLIEQGKLSDVTSGDQFVHWLENYADNDDIIESHNAKESSYTLGHNSFSHMSFDEFKSFYNLYPENLMREMNATALPYEPDSPVDPSLLQSSIDWTTRGAVTPVKDQGNCGSCWSFSTTGSIEGAFKIKYGSLVSFSEQLLVDCDHTDNGCNGGWMGNAYNWATKNGGLCTESSYPYTSGSTGSPGSCHSCPMVSTAAPKSATSVTAKSDSALMSALNIKPVSVAVQADGSNFQLYKSGVLTSPCGTNVNHAVLAVGYGTWSDGTPYYKVKNSWSSGWGMNGYILLKRGVSQAQGQCGILSFPIYPNL